MTRRHEFAALARPCCFAAVVALAMVTFGSTAVAGVAGGWRFDPDAPARSAIVLAAAAAMNAAPLPRPRPGESESPDESAPAAVGAPADADSDAPAAATEDESFAVALPRPRPELTQTETARLLASQFYGFAPDFALRRALDAVNDGRYAEARAVATGHADALALKLIDWTIARQPDAAQSAEEIISVLESHSGWPEPERLVLRAEQAFHALGPAGESVLAFYGATEPRTVGGRLALAGALREAGRRSEATGIVREVWREWPLSADQALTLLTRFGAELKHEDHVFRYRRLVLGGRTADAVAQAKILGPGYENLARAVIAALNRDKDARSLLRGVAPNFLADPLYEFARIRLLRRGGQPIEAARLILQAKPDHELIGEGDVWWEDRMDLSRVLLDRGLPDLAYQVVAEARPDGEGERVEAAFHAGWYALRFLHDPQLAEPHFRELHRLATLQRTQSRASYWLGRTQEALGRTIAARLDFVEAARFGGTFYGQLARQKLGIGTTGLERTPKPSAVDRLRFAGRETVRIIRLLAAAGYADRAAPFVRALAETVDSPGEVTLLVSLARRLALPHAGAQAASIAEQRGMRVASLSAPFVGVPTDIPLPQSVDRALVYAVVRQESAFDHQAVSHAGARGLMQLMPATAKATARDVQLPFSEQRLTTDPLYNATLGAHHLGELLGGLNRSYVLTFCGYNAGPGRAIEWVRAYGDPRGGEVDPVDWIERIPFDETRDYVQKVIENLQVYRSRTGHPLSLSEDLVRGGPQG